VHPFGKYECYSLVILRCASFTQVVTFFWDTAPNYFTVYAPYQYTK
jgi:hypothetical protein